MTRIFRMVLLILYIYLNIQATCVEVALPLFHDGPLLSALYMMMANPLRLKFWKLMCLKEVQDHVQSSEGKWDNGPVIAADCKNRFSPFHEIKGSVV